MSSTPSPTASARREYGIAMLALAAGAGLLLAAAGRQWVTGELTSPGPVAPVPVELTGADLTGTMTGIGWAGLAGVAGLYAARGWARRLVGLLVAVGGMSAVTALWSATRPGALVSAVSGQASDATGAAEAVNAPDLLVIGPAMAAVGAVLVLLAGLAATVRALSWPGMGSRYDRDAAPRATRAETPADLWRSLDAGEDPTLDAHGGATADTADHADTEDVTAPAPLAARPAEPKENH